MKRKQIENSEVGELIKFFAISVIVVLLLLIKFDGVSLWSIFRSCIPGATAIRAVGRFMGFLMIPVVIVICWVVSVFCNSINAVTDFQAEKIIRIGIAVLFMIIMSDCIGNAVTGWLAIEYQEKVDGVEAPPSDLSLIHI